MEKEILKYLSKYIPITKELEEELCKIKFIKCFKKGALLLEEGKISTSSRYRLLKNIKMKHKLTTIFLAGILVFGSCKDKNEIQIPYGAFPIVYKGHLYIKGLADSVKGNFVFDTGAYNLYYDSTYYADNGFKYENTFNAMLPGAGSTPQKVIVVKDTVEFRFGEYLYKTSIVPVLQLKPILGDFADGILGMEYFYNSILEINYEKEYMKIHSSIDSINLEGFTKIKMNKTNNKLFLPLDVIINDTINIAGEYQIDFGSGGAVSLTSSASEMYKLRDNIVNKAAYYTKYVWCWWRIVRL